MVIIVRDSKTGEIITTSRDTKLSDIRKSNEKRRSEGKSIGSSGSLTTSYKTADGNTIIASRDGNVIVKDSKGRVINSFKGDSTAVNKFIQEQSTATPDRSTRTAGDNPLSNVRAGQRKGVYYELGDKGEIKKDVLIKDDSGQFINTGYELTDEGVEQLMEQRRTTKTTSRTVEQPFKEDKTYLDRVGEEYQKEDVLASGYIGSGAVVSAGNKKDTRKAKVKEWIGNPFGAFASPFESGVNMLINPSNADDRTARYINTGTPLEQIGAVAGTVSLYAVPRGTAAVSQWEARVLSQVPKGFRFGAGVTMATAEGIAISKVAKEASISNAPENLKPYIRDNEVFRAARSAEISAEPNFIKRAVGGLNSALNRGQIDAFEKAARQQLEGKGLTGAELDKAVQAQLYRREKVAPFREAAVTLNAGRFSETFGRVNVANIPAKDLTGGFFSRSFRFGRAIAPAGFIEVRGEVAGQRAGVGSDLPFIDTSNVAANVLPTIKKGEGIQFRTRLAEDIGIGALGATTAGVLGGFVGAGATAATGKSGSTSRALGKFSNFIGNVADPSEPVTDFLAGSAKGFIKAPVVTLTPSTSFSNVPARSQSLTFADSLTQTFSFSNSKAPVIVPALSPTDIFVPSGVPANVPIRQPVNPITIVPSNVNEPVFVPSDVPAEVPANVNVNVNVPAEVPVLSSVFRIPPPLPLAFDAKGSGLGGSARKGMKKYVNELKQGEQLLAGLLGGTSKGTTKASTKKRKSKTVKKQRAGYQFFEPVKVKLPFNII